jgi:hypothetical protein
MNALEIPVCPDEKSRYAGYRAQHQKEGVAGIEGTPEHFHIGLLYDELLRTRLAPIDPDA